MNRKPAAILLLLSVAGQARGEDPVAALRRNSPVRADETVLFFTSAAWPSPAKAGSWEVEIHGVIFEEEKRPELSAILVTLLGLNRESLTKPEQAILQQRIALFMVDHERGKSLPVRAGQSLHVLPETGPNGHFRHTVTLSADAMAAGAVSSVLPLTALTPPGDERQFAGCACVLADGPQPLVISDVDDTIKITSVRDRAAAKLNTFCRPFQAVPGMAELYGKWQQQNGAGFCYVSGSPWQLYRPLERFRTEQKFPAGSWHLKHLRLADPETVRAFFAAQTNFKLQAIEPLLARWPQRPVVLVGDSGEQDPEIYATLARRHPQRIARIFIRDASGGTLEAGRCRKAFEGIAAEKWQLFKDPADLPQRLP